MVGEIQGWAKEMELSWEKVSALLQPATAGHARLVLSKTVPFFCTTLYMGTTTTQYVGLRRAINHTNSQTLSISNSGVTTNFAEWFLFLPPPNYVPLLVDFFNKGDTATRRFAKLSCRFVVKLHLFLPALCGRTYYAALLYSNILWCEYLSLRVCVKPAPRGGGIHATSYI